MRRYFLFAFLLAFVPLSSMAQCLPTFFDGFESGNYSPTWTIGSGLTSGSVTTTNPSSGLYRLEGVGGTSTHLTGFSTTIPSATPTQISWDVFPTGTGASNYMVLGDAAVTATNCVAFCYWQGGTNLRFVSGSTAVYNCTPGSWYHIEMRNINWTTHIFDIYINNTLVQANFPFRNSSQNSVSRLHLYNFNSATGVWDNIQVGVPNMPNATSVATNVQCHGQMNGAIDLNVSGGTPSYTYLWSNGATTQDLSGIGGGSYSVTVTDGVGCSTTASIPVVDPDSISLSSSISNLSCNGSMDGAIDNTVTGGTGSLSYAWSSGASTQDLSGLAAGTYVLTITDANACTRMDTLIVDEPTPITAIDSIGMPSCNGDSNGMAMIIPSGGTPGYSYLWTTGSTTASSGPVAAGTYVCMITDSSGCTALDSVEVTEPSALTVTVSGTDPLCAGAGNGQLSANALGGTPAYSYLWSNGGNTATVTAGAGSYLLTLTDANGCTTMDSLTLVDPAALVAIGVASADTGVGDGSIDLTASGGTAPLSYSWSNGATTEDLTGLAFGTYTVTITDANGCTLVDSFTVELFVGVEGAFPLSLQVYPNPFQDQFVLQLAGLGSEPVQLSLMDLQGKVLWTEAVNGRTEVRVAPELASGVYFLRVQVGAQQKTMRLVRQ